jgi:hypothetical protein
MKDNRKDGATAFLINAILIASETCAMEFPASVLHRLGAYVETVVRVATRP